MRGAPEAVAAVVGAAITAHTGTPVAGTAAQNALLVALKAILNDNAEELNQLTRANVEALVNGPYETGMEYLNQAAQQYREAEDREEMIRDAIREFMQAYGQQKHQLFRTALIQYQLGNCFALLGRRDDARQWFQRSHESAVKHLYDSREKVRTAAGGKSTGPLGSALPAMLPAIIKRRQMRREFLEEAPSVLDLIDDLRHLQEKTRKDLDLKFDELDELLPNRNTLEEWLMPPTPSPSADLSREANRTNESAVADLTREVNRIWERAVESEVIRIIETHTTETVDATVEKTFRNNRPQSITQRLTLERQLSPSWSIQYEEAKSIHLDRYEEAKHVERMDEERVLLRRQLQAYKVWCMTSVGYDLSDLARVFHSKIEEQIRTSYPARTFTEELTFTIPPNNQVTANITWLKIWQHGLISLTSLSSVEVPFKVAVRLKATADFRVSR